ncbi:MAG TPA: hypothetical protein VGC72_05780 [Candidatus Elarobacter sp.]
MRYRANSVGRAVAVLALAALACVTARPAAADEITRTWSLTAEGGSDVSLHVKYERRSGGSNRIYASTHTVPVSALRGLGASDVSGSPARRRFEIGHDAGKLVFDGTVGDGRGSGTYAVVADASFQRELARRGIRAATNDELFELTLSDFRLAMLDTALASGFERPTPADLVDTTNRGVTTELLRGFKDVPLTPKTLRALVQLRDHGVTGEYVRAFADAGYRPISTEDLTLARDHGVDARQAAAIHTAMPSLTVKSLALLRDHGVRPSLIEATAAASYRGITASDLTALSDHGVRGDYITGLERAGVRASVADVIRLHDNGVSVNYIQRLRDHGYAHLNVDDIIKLLQHGV